MIHIKHTLWLSVLCLFLSNICMADDGPQRKKTGNATRINFGPVISLYTINKKHATAPTQKISVLAGFRREVHVDRTYKSYFSFGIDYFFHGLNFKSYYFKPDSIKLYDKSFGYNYALNLHELNLPLQYKFLFKRADNSLYSPYITLGYHLRYLLFSNLKITQNGNLIKKDNPDVTFNNPIMTNKLNAFVSTAFGWQKNNLASSKGSFFVELNFRYGFSPYLFEADYAASSLNINGLHLSLQLGLKL